MNTSESTPTPDPQVLDLAVIDELRELGGEEDPQLLHELIELFLEDAPARMAEMEEALDAQNLEGMRRAAHTLKSSSANMGAVTFSQLCRDLEAAARDSDASAFREAHVDCRSAYQAFESELRRLRD